jgi:hypothetical protein
MASDYQVIRIDNERRYGTDIGEIGPMLLAERYADRTHFIYELLQNAEDALSRRKGWSGRRAVTFLLTEHALNVSHYGKPFDEGDVRGICGIAKSTKKLTEIGRFGIGFKSVYAFTDLPEIHSGAEDFAIESFVWPKVATPVDRVDDETVIILPLKAGDADRQMIAKGLRRLGARALLFLRQIEEIEWEVEGGLSGIYLRGVPEKYEEGVRRVALIGQEQDRTNIEENWLVFSRPVSNDGEEVGNVEVAFSLKGPEASSIEPVAESHLVAFFPTVLSTNLGFLVQGPYRTTPSRDNVASDEPWNLHLVRETSALFVEALRWLRAHGMLDAGALSCLPLDRARFGEANMFAPLFEATRELLSSEEFLPRFDGGHVAAGNARLARTQELREIISTEQLGALFGHGGELIWLSGEITPDRMPELRQYLMQELGVGEVTPETVVPKLSKTFLEAQSDDWVPRLYEFLAGQPALFRQGKLNHLPFVRLENGTHVAARPHGQPQAYLPSDVETGFPTVRRSVCASDESLKFLKSLGLTKPDAVDDVIWNVLPKYRAEEISDDTYESDIHRILTAFATDSKAHRDKLVAALRETSFVMAVDAGDRSEWASKPADVYLATERLKELFSGVTGVRLVDDEYACLRGEKIRELLEACGTPLYLKPIKVHPGFTAQEQLELRRKSGYEQTSGYSDTFEDWTLEGLDKLLGTMPTLPAQEVIAKAKVLWEALGDVVSRRGQSFFTGTYRWTHYGQRSSDFPSTLTRRLNETAWVPGAEGRLERPEFVIFDSLDWKADPFLQSKIHFKPPIIETLAKEVGIEPGVLDLLKKLGVTSEAELRDRLGLADEPANQDDGPPGSEEVTPEVLPGDMPVSTPPISEPDGPEPQSPEDHGGGSEKGRGQEDGGPRQPGAGGGSGGAGSGAGGAAHAGRRAPGSSGGRPFISYVAASPDEEAPDPDGLDQAARMALEDKAIDFILSLEPEWQREPPNNMGFDLSIVDEDGWPTRWCEVKAMTGSLHDRPVGLKRAQFECARQHGEAYWLYIVEHAGSDNAHIVRIQNPAGRARTFTFDRGWINVAESGEPTKN